MTKLDDLHTAGQSVWLDFIRRDLIENDGLAALVADGIRGITSNPTIFQKAIGGSEEYDDQIREILSEEPHASTTAVFERLAIRDIRDAADALRSVYDDSQRADGFVSLEVSPHLAMDTAGTIADAKRLWGLVDRPNLMIKVPATDPGIPAIEELIAAGLNVNATLMFSMDDYEAVAQAYVRGLARADEPASVASVASFFVSRVDTATDDALEKVGTDAAMALRGAAAVANAKLTYRRYREIFEGDLFAAQRARGGRPQRVLWASTSTKNPEYSDVLYVEALIGPNTVNTMPPATIDAFRDHGAIDATALTIGVDEAAHQIQALGQLSIDFDEITAQLQVDGVASFADSYDDMLATLDEKIAALRG